MTEKLESGQEASINLPETLIQQIFDKLIDRLDNKLRPPLIDVKRVAK